MSEPVDQIRNLLRRRHVDVLMAAVDERDDEGVEYTPATRLRIGHQAKPAEVDFGELARPDVGDAHRDALPLMKSAALDREAVQRAVRHTNAKTAEQLKKMQLRQAMLN